MLANFKNFCKDNEKDLFLITVIVLVAVLSFGLGRLSKIEENKVPIRIENLSANVSETRFRVAPAAETEFLKETSGSFVASKNGSKYHFPWCSGAQRIKESNKIWFNSREEAESEGYTPAANCKGL